jgi:hypothetical protein
VCVDAAGQRVSFRRTRVAFYLQSRSDTVYVTVLNAQLAQVATMAGSGRYIRAGTGRYASFAWNGRMTDGRYAPAGTYTFQVALKQEGRTLPISGVSVRVESSRPEPRISSISVGSADPGSQSPTPTRAGTTPDFAPGHQTVTLGLAPGQDLGADVLVYRASDRRSVPLKLVKTFGINPQRRTAVWNGMINGLPAPRGTYLIGLAVTDDACTRGQFPRGLDPTPGSTAGSGVNVSYLAASPPMDPVPAGQVAAVPVQVADGNYSWTLRLAGQRRVISQSHGSHGDVLHVRLPRAGLYELHIVSVISTTVPLVASAVGPRAAAAKVLVVLPALSWQGANATDDDSDGLIDTLADGSQVSLERPLVAGLPSGIGDEASLLHFLTAQGYRYDVTTDVALAEGVGPSLRGRSGVILDGRFRWLPTQLVGQLRRFAQSGGGVFADGIRSLQAQAQITDGNYGPIAGPARPMATDPFGVTHGTVSPSDGEIITTFTDGLGLFSTAAALQFPTYQVLEPAGHRLATAAGVSRTAPAVIGFHLKAGTVVEAGLPDFGLSLASDPDSDELLSRVWQVVLR